MEAIIRGIRREVGKETALEGLERQLTDDLSAGTPDIRHVIECLDALGKVIEKEQEFLLPELMELGYGRKEALGIKKDALAVLSADELFRKVKRELSGMPFQIRRIAPREDAFEGWMPTGVLGHVTSSNDAMLPFFSAVEGVLAGNINLIKTASGASKVAMALTERLCSMYPEMAPYFYIFPFSSKDEKQLREMFSLCNVVAVWGSDRATAGVRKLAPAGVRIVEWGSRISFAYFTEAGISRENLRGLAEDICVNDQMACSAPQMVYLELLDEDFDKDAVTRDPSGDDRKECGTYAELPGDPPVLSETGKRKLLSFASQVMEALQESSHRYPALPLSRAEAAEITTQNQLTHLDEVLGEAKLLQGDGCRIYVRYDHELTASPLHRTLIVKAIRRQDLLSALRPFRSYLQSTGLACGTDEVVRLTSLLSAGGVTRIVPPGSQMSGYSGEPHDGGYALPQYMRRLSFQSNVLPAGCMSLAEMKPARPAPFAPGTPVLRKADFPQKREIVDTGYLLLESGGSSGKAKYAPHTYEDAEVTYRESACALLAAGIDPKKDVCMNLFYAGDLYGGFISIYEALKDADVIQLPMAAEMDTALVAREIIGNRVNVLLGMPTYLLRLLRDQEEALSSYGGIEKILYGGEHFDPAAADYVKEKFHVKRIASLVYGCNEIGAMGYACPECEDGVHHVADTKYLEILKIDSDEPVTGGEVGRLVWTPVDQENIGIARYEIGDLGRWVMEPCACGRKAPRFQLLGRFGDVFKFATNYVSYRKIRELFGKRLGYAGELQVLLTYEGCPRMTICIQENPGFSEEEAVLMLEKNYPELAECLRDRTGEVRVRTQKRADFLLSSGGGKVRSVVDMRTGQ